MQERRRGWAEAFLRQLRNEGAQLVILTAGDARFVCLFLHLAAPEWLALFRARVVGLGPPVADAPMCGGAPLRHDTDALLRFLRARDLDLDKAKPAERAIVPVPRSPPHPRLGPQSCLRQPTW